MRPKHVQPQILGELIRDGMNRWCAVVNGTAHLLCGNLQRTPTEKDLNKTVRVIMDGRGPNAQVLAYFHLDAMKPNEP